MDGHGEPAARCLSYFGIFYGEHARDVGACEVGVEDADGVAGEREAEGELGGDGGFAHAAFAREDLGNLLERKMSRANLI